MSDAKKEEPGSDSETQGVGERIRMVRKHLKMTQAALASIMGISGASVSEIESGNAKPRFEVFYHFSKDLNVNLNFLLHGKGEMFKQGKAPLRSHGLDTLPGEVRDFLESFCYYYENSPVFRLSMLAYFTTLCMEKAPLIKEEIETYKGGGK